MEKLTTNSQWKNWKYTKHHNYNKKKKYVDFIFIFVRQMSSVNRNCILVSTGNTITKKRCLAIKIINTLSLIIKYQYIINLLLEK